MSFLMGLLGELCFYDGLIDKGGRTGVLAETLSYENDKLKSVSQWLWVKNTGYLKNPNNTSVGAGLYLLTRCSDCRLDFTFQHDSHRRNSKSCFLTQRFGRYVRGEPGGGR